MSAAAKSDERAAPLRVSRAALRLVGLIVVLTFVAAGIGLFWTDDGEPYDFTTLRAETAEIEGQGLYRHDTVFAAAGYRAVDATLLFLPPATGPSMRPCSSSGCPPSSSAPCSTVAVRCAPGCC